MFRLNGCIVTPTIFPDKTSQIWKLPYHSMIFNDYMSIEWNFNNEGDFLQLAQLVDLVQNYTRVPIKLYIDYLPYGRQDKDINLNSTFALRTFSKLLNSLNLAEVMILDPHSNIALELINNSKSVYSPLVELTFKEYNFDLAFYPDRGAYHKYNSLYNFKSSMGYKVRDESTGAILSYRLSGVEDYKNKKILIIDDICDGGGTFILAAEKLYEAGAKEVSLFVTHGLFTKGKKILYDSGIASIHTKNGLETKEN